MKLRALATDFDTLKINKRISVPKVARILDQRKFTGDNDGACQTAAIFGCLEGKVGPLFTNEMIQSWYTRMDSVFGGKGEKVNRSLQYMATEGVVYKNTRFLAENLTVSRAVTFDDLWEAQESYDGVIVDIRLRSSFFSGGSGILYKDLKLHGGHAMRVCGQIMYKGERAVLFQNSWGEEWGHGGFGIVTESKFHLLKLAGCYAFDIKVES